MIITAETPCIATRKLDEVQFADCTMGYFPALLDAPIDHGFSWGEGSENMAFRQHNGNPDIIVERNKLFLRSMGEISLRDTVVIEAYANRTVIDIDHRFLAETNKTERGIFTPAHSVFTQIPGQTLAVKPGDCTASVVYGIGADGPLTGIIHASRRELGLRNPYETIKHLITAYGCDPADLRIAVAPSLATSNHKIKAQNVSDTISNEASWGAHVSINDSGDTCVDMTGYLLAQYLEAGVSEDNVFVYDVDTYQAAQTGQSFSYRYAVEQGVPDRNGRFVVAVRLRENVSSNIDTKVA